MRLIAVFLLLQLAIFFFLLIFINGFNHLSFTFVYFNMFQIETVGLQQDLLVVAYIYTS